VLAAGAGTRLQPLTRLRPKALCPVDNVLLVDLAIGHARTVTASVAVNCHHRRDLMEAHLAGRVHVSVEEPEALGTAGALGQLRDWIDGRHVLVLNADAWHEADLAGFAREWDGERIRLLTVVRPGHGTWGDHHYAGAALMPWSSVRDLEPEPSGLYEVSWRQDRHLDLVVHDGPYFDCGTPAAYLAANLTSSRGQPVVGQGAVVEGTVEESVIWPGATVGAGEHLSRAIRAHEHLTVFVR
jgi:NDP-sugar pyrophosphorylase family protein